mgnify:CR=1 FL=1
MPGQAGVRDGPVTGDLVFQHIPDGVQVHRFAIGKDVPHIQKAFVRCRGAHLPGALPFHQIFAVVLHAGHIGVGGTDLHKGFVRPRPGRHLDYQVVGAFDKAGGADTRFQQFHRPGTSGIGDAFQHRQTAGGIAPADAQQGGDLNAAASAGIGDRDALDVLDDIAAAGQLQGIRLPAQDLAGQSARIGDGDGLGTAHGGDQFPPQQLAVYGIYLFL